ncbi:MAG TPA: hypothetical protein VFW68_08595 [Rhodocyclaceae bacterium]|nr:hypothetical protein [Rhodocyclaceae bacterium]
MRFCWRICLVALSLSVLSGCNALSSFGEDRYWLRADRWRTSDVTALLYYFDYLRALSPADQMQEQERARRAFSKDKSDFHRLQLSMALDAPAASLADHRQAASLLEPLARETKGHDRELHLLATLMLSGNRRSDDLERKLEAVKEIERNLLQRDRRPSKGTDRDTTKGQAQ